MGKYTLKTELKLEPILLSLDDDNYSDFIQSLKTELSLYDESLVKILDNYLWIAETQLGNHHLSKETLKKEFPTLNFTDAQSIKDTEELQDYIQMFLTQRKQRFISNKIVSIGDTVRSQGLSDEIVDDLYKYISLSETETGYESITSKFKELYTASHKLQGLSFLCPELDKLTGGIRPGQICTILGAPGSMKTTYSSNIAYNALKEGKNVLYLSLEEQPMQLYSKWLSRASIDAGSPLSKQEVEQKKLEENDEKILLDKVVPYFEGLSGKLYIVGEEDLSNYSLTSLESKFKEVEKKAIQETSHGIDILVVDHIQLLKFAVSGLQENTVINMYVSFFRQQCLSWLHSKRGIVVMLLSQANRLGYDYAMKHDGQYLPQHVAEASEVERASAYIVSVYTDAMIQITKQLKVGAVKLRGSQLPTSTITVYADGQYYQVGDSVATDNTSYSTSDLDLGTDYSNSTYKEQDLLDSGILNKDDSLSSLGGLPEL